MDLIYTVSLIIALSGISLLLSLVYVEKKSGKLFLPKLRNLLDRYAVDLNNFGTRVIYVIEHAPSFIVQFGYFLVHIFAVFVALASRASESKARKLVDFVSHKQSFKRRETRSQFLKDVSGHKDSLVVPQEVTKSIE